MLANLARQVYARLDAEWQRAAQEYERQTGSKLPCGPGCADCCKASNAETPFVSLPMNRLEADLLWQALIVLPLSTRMSLVGRERDNYSAACMLLSPDGLCIVYEARPMWCRIFGLPGVVNCDRASVTQQGVWAEQWKEAVNETWRKLRSIDDNFVPLRQLIRELAYVR